MELFDTATVLARVLTSGVVMSIEKSDRELPGLARVLTRQTGRSGVVLANSRTAGIVWPASFETSQVRSRAHSSIRAPVRS